MSKYKQLNPGDRVLVTKRVTTEVFWGPQMDNTVGTVLEVTDISKKYPLLSNGYYYPRSSLRKLRGKSK